MYTRRGTTRVYQESTTRPVPQGVLPAHGPQGVLPAHGPHWVHAAHGPHWVHAAYGPQGVPHGGPQGVPHGGPPVLLGFKPGLSLFYLRFEPGLLARVPEVIPSVIATFTPFGKNVPFTWALGRGYEQC